MNNYDPPNASGNNPIIGAVSAKQQFMTKVFGWMAAGLAISGTTAYLSASSPVIIQTLYSNMFLLIVLVIGLFALVWNISANILKMSYTAALANFAIYAALNGLVLSSVFLVYTTASIASTFMVTSGTFAAMAIYGFVTKKDLSGVGSMAIMALIGIIIAQIVNMFLHNSGLSAIISYVGVLVFVALTAYDVQKIKNMGEQSNYHANLAISGALALYLDFVNLFIYLLRILGNRRD
ncbi:MAG: Bax inhibitor-1/YccA family protein [Candidatus Caenarcaniphilales bacterium]|jgi:FtsH-binding integral membrane protein|nr:Bax inhibitor-1/YccA family protein [Candidatus Caenarcaniphilales bacterium]